MNIVYRVSPFKQMNPSPYFPDDKYKLVKMCHNSFLKAKSPHDKVTYLLDRIEGWQELFTPHGEVINYKAGNRAGSITQMYDVAQKLEGNILFVEDDYLWRPDTIKHIEESVDELVLVSPYDHPDHYVRWPNSNFKVINNIVYRDAPSNTHTFAVKREFFDTYIRIFHDYLDQDHPLFERLPGNMFQPTYSFATHLVEGLLAHNIDWDQYVEKYRD